MFSTLSSIRDIKFYGRIRIPRIPGNFDTYTDSVYQALFSPMMESLGLRLATAMPPLSNL